MGTPRLTADDFEWDDDWWTTSAVLPSWKGFQSRSGHYGARNQAAPSNGTVEIVFAPEGRDEDDEPLSNQEVALVKWAIAHEAEMQRSLLDALLERYPELRKRYLSDLDPKDMPEVRDRDGFKPLIGLHQLNVHPIEKDGLPYVGFELGCTWDDEHGLGALMHGTRVVEIGGADTAILLWIAERDAASTRPKTKTKASTKKPAAKKKAAKKRATTRGADSAKRSRARARSR